jgi:hypothetical protein
MGGSAFPALDTPRMPLSVYQHALKTIHAKLLTLYAQVSTPIEASAKMDYGDVDVLVYQPLPGWKKIVGEKGVTAKVILTEEGEGKETSPTEDELAALLGAKAWKRDKDSEEIHFAIPWPKEFTYEGVVEATAPSPQETTTITTAVSQLSLSSPSPLHSTFSHQNSSAASKSTCTSAPPCTPTTGSSYAAPMVTSGVSSAA